MKKNKKALIEKKPIKKKNLKTSTILINNAYSYSKTQFLLGFFFFLLINVNVNWLLFFNVFELSFLLIHEVIHIYGSSWSLTFAICERYRCMKLHNSDVCDSQY